MPTKVALFCIANVIVTGNMAPFALYTGLAVKAFSCRVPAPLNLFILSNVKFPLTDRTLLVPKINVPLNPVQYKWLQTAIDVSTVIFVPELGVLVKYTVE